MKKLFQYIVITSLLLQVVLSFIFYASEYMYDEKELQLLSYHGANGFLNTAGVIPYIVFFGYIISSIGLLYFKKWALNLFLGITVISALPIWGIMVILPIENTLGYLLSLADGAIFAIAYLTSVSDDFKKNT